VGELLLSGTSQQSLSSDRSTRPQEAASVVMQQTQGELAGGQTLSRNISPQRVWLGLFTETDGKPSVGEHVSLFREPDAGKPPVRFDERGQETEPSQAGLRWRSESLSQTATGRLTPLRLFSTLHKKPRRQQGHLGRERAKWVAIRRRRVAIEDGLCRSVRTGSAAGRVAGLHTG